MRVKLTDLTIRSLPVPEKGQTEYYDINHPGLCLRVSQGGSKVFTFLNRQNGARRRVTIGKYPAIGLSDARAACRGMAANPAMNTTTFGEAVASYLALATAHMSRSSIYELTRILTKTFLPLHAVPITSVTSKHISDIIDGLPANALYTHGRVKTFMRWCRMRSLIQVNPIEFLPAPSKYVPRDRILTDAEIKSIWHAASHMGTYGTVVQLLICTGCRRNEIASLRKEWIQDGLLLFPKEVTKAKREHILPITDCIASLLSTPMAASTNWLLFPARDRENNSLSGWSKYKTKLDKLSGVTDWVHHDTRRYFRTSLIHWGCCTAEIAERLIGHKVGGDVFNIYDRYDRLPEKRAALQAYESHLKRVLQIP